MGRERSDSPSDAHRALVARFLDKVQPQADGCWLWTAAKSDGYGLFKIGRIQHQAHRLAYEMFTGRIPSGHEIDHVCRNRSCVNPEHLEAVTRRENLRRADAHLNLPRIRQAVRPAP